MVSLCSEASRVDACVARQARLRPDAIAVTCEGQHVSYRQLDERANQLAHRLRRLGVGADDLVGVALDRSIDLVVALLACMRAGGAYLPLDPNYPRDRLLFIIGDARPKALLTSAACRAAVETDGLTILELDDFDTVFANEPTDDPAAPAGRDSLAYIIYTSGSTGVPKGCLITHDNVLQLFTSTEPWFGFDEQDVWTFFHSSAFDFSVWEIWGALVYGGRVVVVPYKVSRSPAEFLSLLVREKVTVLNQTPSAFRTVIAADQEREPSPLSLRYVIFGGEALDFQMLRPWFERYGDSRPALINMYGITETTVFVTYRPVSLPDLDRNVGSVIGEAMPGWGVKLLDEHRQPVAVDAIGELYITGVGLARGYLNRPELNRERFLELPLGPGGSTIRAYKSGDLGRLRSDGELEYLGRSDHQVKIRGFRIETGEIENRINAFAGIDASAVIARTDRPGDEPRLVAYVQWKGSAAQIALRAYLKEHLPEFMVPGAIVSVDHFPLTTNGKLDRNALPAPSRERPDTGTRFVEPANAMERLIADTFASVLDLEAVGSQDNFFDIGGTSLLAMRTAEQLRRQLDRPFSIALLFTYATPAALAASLATSTATTSAGAPVPADLVHEPIAIIGMACRLPSAPDVDTFWNHLAGGHELITRFGREELDVSVTTALRNDPAYVAARGVIEDSESFDAGFFGIPEREADLIDPQQRVFLELAWECLESAGYAADRTGGTVGVFAGVGTGTYLRSHLVADPALAARAGDLALQLTNDKDYVATRVAYRLNLRGPAVNVNTACSTSLVAVAQAVDSLRMGRCGMALAGAASITFPQRSGHLHEEGAMLSSDGSTRTFDATSSGTVFSDGAAVVLLKPLSRALQDGDQIHAVIRGVATNNDGGGKASFSAPSSEGQCAVIIAAQEDAGIEPAAISYVEAHGTGTPLGDPVEMEGLTRAFQRHGRLPQGSCLVGSVKSNIGHAVTAAGVSGLIKTALSLSNELIPASINFTTPNPRIDFAGSPFAVASRATAWPRTGEPRRAGISSFGVGGTNAHVVIEEAPRSARCVPEAVPQLLLLSARTTAALSAMESRLATHLQQAADVALADVAFTLREGRARFAHRTYLVAEQASEAGVTLQARSHPLKGSRLLSASTPPLAWVFPGQGAQYAGMGKMLYERHAAFRDALDECAEAFASCLDGDLRQRMFNGSAETLAHTSFTQPAIFSTEYALARLWLGEDIKPALLIGHSIGEYAAAVIAQVMSLQDAARVVALRASLMAAQPPGSMLSVRMPEQDLAALLPAELSIAGRNAPNSFVLSGASSAIDALLEKLGGSVPSRRLQTSHAFHSGMMDAVVPALQKALEGICLAPPKLPIVSTMTGRRLDDAAATDPAYWAQQLRAPVLFSNAVQSALRDGVSAFLEVGPGGSLSSMIRQHRHGAEAPLAISSLGSESDVEHRTQLAAQGQLWTLGFELPRQARGPCRRVQLPTYPFERKRHALQSHALPTMAAPASSHSPPTNNDKAISPMTNFPSSRKARLRERIRELLEDVSGSDLASAAPDANLMDLGLDSLVLTQSALQVRRTFGVAVSFRQLMESFTSIEALAVHLDATMPAEPEPPAAPAPATVPVAAHPFATTRPAAPLSSFDPAVLVAAGGGLLQQIISQQMQVMNEQLEVLRGLSGGALTQAHVPAQPMTPALPSAPTTASVSAKPERDSAAPVGEAPAPVRYDVKKAFGAIARIHTQGAEISGDTLNSLRAFMDKYVARTRRSKEYTSTHRAHLADPRVVNGFRPATKEITYQVVVERSKGPRVWDLDGNEYIDVLNGFGMNLFGWQPDFVQQAVRAQLDAGYEIGPQHPLAGEVARLICELTGFDRAGLCNTGSEAVMAAIRIARTVTGRNLVVLFTGSYHGTFDEVVVRAGRGGKGIPAAPGIMSGVFGDVRVLDYGSPEALEFIRANIDDIAAVLVEPVQSRRPEFQPREFLQQVRKLTTSGGACLIFDEVITGFRAHLRGAQEVLGVRADLATYGKVIGGGFPVGVVAGDSRFMDALDGGQWQYGDASIPVVGVTYFAGTFVRHPLALAAAHAVLLHLKQHGTQLQTGLNETTARFVSDLNTYCRQVGAPIELRRFSSLWRVVWQEDHPLQDLLFAMLRLRGVHILDNFPCFMTTAHSAQDIEKVKTAFRGAVAEMQSSGFLPASAWRKAQ